MVLLGAPIVGGGEGSRALAAIQLLVLLGVVVLAFGALVGGRLEWRRTSADVPLAAFVGLVIVQLAIGNRALVEWAVGPGSAGVAGPGRLWSVGTVAPGATLGALLVLLAYVGTYVLTVQTTTDRARVERLVACLVAVGAVLAAAALVDYGLGAPRLLAWRGGELRGRLAGTFVNPGHFGIWLSMLVCLGVGHLLARAAPTEGRPRWRASALAIVGLTVMVVAVLFTLSRAALAGLVVGLGATVTLGVPRSRGVLRGFPLAAVVLAVIAVGVVTVWVGPMPILGRLERALGDSRARWLQVLTSLPMLAEFPLLGVGLGGYRDVYARYQPAALNAGRVFYPYAHNDLLQLVVETGLAGAVVALFLTVRVTRDLVGAHLFGRGRCPAARDPEASRRRDPFSVGLAAGALGALAALLVEAWFDFGARIPAVGALAATCLGLATVTLHTRFGSEGSSLTRDVTRPLAASPPALVLAGLLVMTAAAGLSWPVVRPALVDAALGAGHRDRDVAVTRALALSPGDPRALSERAALRFERARRTWNTALGADGRPVASWAERQATAIRGLHGAIDDLRRALVATPTDPFLHERLGWAHGLLYLVGPPARQEERRAAITHLRRAVALAPANPYLRRSLAALALTPSPPWLDVALPAARGAIRLDSGLLGDLFERLLPLGLDEARWAEAVPATPADRFDLAERLEARGFVDIAGGLYRRAVAEAGSDDTAVCHWALALFLLRRGAFAEALAEADAGLRSDPDNPELHLVRGRALAGLRRADADSAFAAALAHAPPDGPGPVAIPFRPPTLRMRALVLGMIGAGQSLGAVRYRRAFAVHLIDEGRWAEARRQWDRVLAVRPNDARGTFLRGLALEHLGEEDAALAAFRHVLEMDGEDPRPRLHLAERLWEREEYVEAMALWRSVVTRDPENVPARLGLVRGLLREGDRLGARRELADGLRYAPDDPALLATARRIGG